MSLPSNQHQPDNGIREKTFLPNRMRRAQYSKAHKYTYLDNLGEPGEPDHYYLDDPFDFRQLLSHARNADEELGLDENHSDSIQKNISWRLKQDTNRASSGERLPFMTDIDCLMWTPSGITLMEFKESRDVEDAKVKWETFKKNTQFKACLQIITMFEKCLDLGFSLNPHMERKNFSQFIFVAGKSFDDIHLMKQAKFYSTPLMIKIVDLKSSCEPGQKLAQALRRFIQNNHSRFDPLYGQNGILMPEIQEEEAEGIDYDTFFGTIRNQHTLD
jgi:hypothetical protein